MIIDLCPVSGRRTVGEGIHILSFSSASISRSVRAGQFVNIKVEGSADPLLRRPFSVYRVAGSDVEIVFNVVGKGTQALSQKSRGDMIDVLGPLGVPFATGGSEFDTGVLVAGGLGVAPLPMLTAALHAAGKSILTFLGARSAGQLIESHLENLHLATEDGSRGFSGNVVALARKTLAERPAKRPKIFGCGPTAMLRALAELARTLGIPCEVSLEGPMGCGIGICQGCPVELAGEEKKYALMCKDGPTFDIRKIKI
ncbi:MAG TPA: dihydroorotate dehydrogenase electron transfer subunit [Bacteroidota bacterium]|nr:dihydroorotate dehydrogenase electron transfer subunit [Bacteroidota bacterium]